MEIACTLLMPVGVVSKPRCAMGMSSGLPSARMTPSFSNINPMLCLSMPSKASSLTFSVLGTGGLKPSIW